MSCHPPKGGFPPNPGLPDRPLPGPGRVDPLKVMAPLVLALAIIFVPLVLGMASHGGAR